jgi:DNA primase
LQKPSKKQRRNLERATTRYQADLSEAVGYLEKRGISEQSAIEARLGVVVSPETGHEHAAGRLAIPYVDKIGVYAIKFRCLVHEDCKAEGCPKYLGLPGQETSLYGILDVDSTEDTIHITEGEFDRWVVKQVFNQPCVGVPGVSQWKIHAPYHFGGFDRVVIWPDGDKAGTDLAHKIRKDVRQAEVVAMPHGKDVTDIFLEFGADVLREMAGTDEEGDE